jgi:YggT family protein
MFAEIFNLVIDTLSSLYVMIVLMRFILQLSRADFYNPISQFVVKATNPLLIPLRRLVPGIAGIDLASLVLAIIVQSVALGLKVAVLGYAIDNPVNILLLAAVLVASVMIKIYFWSLIIMIVASWIAPGSGHPALLLINQICEPLMKPFRSILPAMGGLDLSPILAFLALQVLETVFNHLMRMI